MTTIHHSLIYVTVPGKRDQFGNFFQNRVIATAGKSKFEHKMRYIFSDESKV